jgi:hypothetical protein
MVAAAGITTTEVPDVAGGEAGGSGTDLAAGDDPQPDKVSTAESSVITWRRLIRLEFISYTSVEGEIQGIRRGPQWTRCQLLFNSSSTGNALY